MSVQRSGSAAAVRDKLCLAARATGDETSRIFAVALLVSFGVCSLVGQVASVAALRRAPIAVPAAAPQSNTRNAAHELVAELGRSVIDPQQILSLVAESGMTHEEAIGAFRLARRAAAVGRNWQKARRLGELIAQLEGSVAGG